MKRRTSVVEGIIIKIGGNRHTRMLKIGRKKRLDPSASGYYLDWMKSTS